MTWRILANAFAVVFIVLSLVAYIQALRRVD